MKNSDLVSIIIPAYNCEKSIEKCVDSCIKQSYKNIEIIVIDDGSDDKTCDIVTKKYSKIKLFSIKNSGPGNARNFGLEKSSGDYVMFLDADDYLNKYIVEKMVNIIKKNNVDIVKCNYFIDNGKNIKKNNFHLNSISISKNEMLNSYMLKSSLWNAVWGQLIKKDLLYGIKFDLNRIIGEDLLFNVKLYNKMEKLYFLDDYLYYYYENPLGITKQLNEYKIKKNMSDVLQNYTYLYDFFNPENQNDIIRRCVRAIISYERQLLYLNPKELSYLKMFNQDDFLVKAFSAYNEKKYKYLVNILKSKMYFVFYLYIILLYKPLKIIKEFSRKWR